MSSPGTADSFKETYQEAIALLRTFDGICPRDCDLCEDREILMLIPGEAQLIAEQACEASSEERELFRVLNGSSGSQSPCVAQCQTSRSCGLYESRPIDCRSFPAVPEFDLDSADVHVEVSCSYCPIADRLPVGFTDAVETAWRRLSPYLPQDWKRRFNETPLSD